MNDINRRRFVTRAASTFLGVGLLPVTEQLLTGTAFAVAGEKASKLQQVATAKSVIYLYMSGGMSHLDTLDVKPGSETQGPTQAIHTSADGVQISEYLPNLARQMHHAAIINSVSSTQGAHEQGNYFMHTSYSLRGTIKHPSMGAWLDAMLERGGNTTLPSTVYVGNDSRHPGAGFFPPKYSPLMVNNPESGMSNVKIGPGLTEDRFNKRLGLSAQLDADFRQRYATRNVNAYTSMYEDAVQLMKSKDLEAFDLSKEDADTKELYGKSQFGQGCLLARRLVERGVRFVEVSMGGWDTHTANFIKVPENCDNLDDGLSALISDLAKRGLLDSTLIVLATEFGRTPDINQNVGRDHYPKAFSALLAGGGIKGGQRFGMTDERGANVVDKLVTIPDLNATIAYALGLPLNQVVYSPSKRPFTIADQGKPVTSLFA